MQAYTLEESRAIVQDNCCADCGGRLINPWGGAYGVDGHIVMCGSRKWDHRTIKRYRATKRLSDGKEYDIVTQRPVDESQALAIPNTKEKMLARVKEAEAVGMWPQKMSPEQSLMIAQVALAYGLDPFMGEIMPYQGRPFVTIAGRRRKDAEAGHYPSIRHRPLTSEERAMYEDAGVIQPGDLCGMTILEDANTGQMVEGFAKVTKDERESKKTYRDGPRKGQEYSASPVVAANPIEMWQKRGERRVREIAYGPIARPAGLDAQIRVIEEGQVIEGKSREVDTFTGEIHEPHVSDTDEIFGPDEAPDAPPVSIPDAFKSVVDQAGNHGLDLEAFCQQVLPKGCKSIEDFQKMGGTAKTAETRLAEWVKKQAQAAG